MSNLQKLYLTASKQCNVVLVNTIKMVNENKSSNNYKKGKFNRKRPRFENDNQDNGRRNFSGRFNDSNNTFKKRRMIVGDRIKETDVGITEYISKIAFSGTIKDRHSDFHVNEIDLNGEIAMLTNQDIPVDPLNLEDLDGLKNKVTTDIWEKLQSLTNINDHDNRVEIDVTEQDKEQRRNIHLIAKKLADVQSQTVDKDDRKFIVVTKNKLGFVTRKDQRVDWTKRGGNFCHFILHKVNTDTMDALNRLAQRLKLKTNNFTYAGTKDRRAWTSQWISIKKVDPARILSAVQSIRGIYVGNFKFSKDPLKLGMLSGNRFRLAVKNLMGDDNIIEEGMISLKKNGFINYYGLQRFGTTAAIPTHEIGKAFLQGKWTEAVDLILKPREEEDDKNLSKARQIYSETKDAAEAFKCIKNSGKIEAHLLRGLCFHGNKKPVEALNYIPKNTRLMYIHSYQSFVWNRIVSKRLKEFGLKPIVGDLVFENETEDKQNNDMNDIIDSSIEEDERLNDEEIELNQVNKENTECNNKVPNVKILTEEDLPKYSIQDIIMPLPGWKMTYPSYAKQWYDEFLGSDGFTTDMSHKNKTYNLGGAYRKIIEVPTNLSWKIVHYNVNSDELILSDLQLMRKQELTTNNEGSSKALIIDMCLKPSTYATMALREILKCDTSAQHQAAQSAAFDIKNKKEKEEVKVEIDINDSIKEQTQEGEQTDVKT